MVTLSPTHWTDYELLDSGNGKRLERFGKYTLVRPDPQCLWKPLLPSSEWQKADAVFQTEGREKGQWVKNKNLPSSWQIAYQDLKILIKLSPFKHTGVFPEQAVHWDFIQNVIARNESSSDKAISNNDPVPKVDLLEIASPQTPRNDGSRQFKVLNLFGYTGLASLAAAAAGAQVTHVDASYPTIGWARENQKLSGLDKAPIRWILEDCLKFVEREVKRGNAYEGIVLDPPVYGHGPKGEKWDFNILFPKLMSLCSKIMSSKKAFLIVNAYAVSASSVMLENVLKDYFTDGIIESGELVLEESKNKRQLSTGIFARWSR